MTTLSDIRPTTALRKNAGAIDHTRVIGIFAHVDAGKTTTSEAFLYYTGRIHRAGSVDDGDTQLDWMTQERERGITITSAATTCTWRRHRINLIDTPGHIDFSAEVVRAIRVIDGAVMVLCAVGGVEPQTEAVWMHADRQCLPRIICVNKLDRLGADFDGIMAEIHKHLTPNAVALHMPIGREKDFAGVVDLLSQEALVWRGGAMAVEPIPASMAVKAAAARAALVDTICETDDALLERRLEGHEPGRRELDAALRRATLAGTLVPVVAASARDRIGVEPLLDAVVAYLPSPTDMTAERRTALAGADNMADPDGPLCASAFKIATDPHVGHLTWVRVFSGRLASGRPVYNPRTGELERVGRIYRMHADHREQVDHAAIGDVVGLVGVKGAATGDTLCDPDHPVELESFTFPDPVIMVALAPGSVNGRDKLQQAVGRLCAGDPTLVARFDHETDELTLAGLGELHLEVAVDRLRTEFGVVPRVSQPQVSYHETIRRPAEATGAYTKQTGGHGHYAKVDLRVEPLARGEGVVFENEASPADLPTDFVRPVELGVRAALEKGVIAGYSVTDLRVTLVDGRCHEIDSSAADFEIAGSMAVRQAVRRAAPALLEPMMRLDVTVGEDHLGAVTADLGRRRGKVLSLDMKANRRLISGDVPLAEARGYATDLRSLTQGRCTFTLEFRRYDIVPETLARAIVEQRRIEGKIAER